MQRNYISVKLKTMPPGTDPVATGQVYYVLYNSDESYVVKNVDGRCLDIYDGLDTQPGASLVLRNCDGTTSQRWKVHYSSGLHYLQNLWSGLWATSTGESELAGVSLEVYRDVPTQRWDIPIYGIG